MKIVALLLMISSLASDPFVHRVDDAVYPDQLFPQVLIETSHGEITVELDRRRAPVTVNNFLSYLKNGDYDNTIFHRVMEGFVVQGGGYRSGWESIELQEPIMNESGNGLTNEPYTIAMARFDDPHSATSQFYFNLAANDSLDPNRRSWGYTVFGSVITGREVVDAINQVETGFDEELGAADVPVTPVVLRKMSLVEQ